MDKVEVEVGTRTPKLKPMGMERRGRRARSSRSGAKLSMRIVGRAAVEAAKRKGKIRMVVSPRF